MVRSVASNDLTPGDLKLALIEHFRDPMKGANLIRPKEVLELCQSDFERDFGRCLLDRGYRIRPQVKVGDFSIDFVIEGADDRRLAVELDGDMYHGPDKWADDVRRQRALERFGWVFWRCWGSAWESDREACLADLKQTLARLGIEPVGMGEIDGAFTEHIEVPPPQPITAAPILDKGEGTHSLTSDKIVPFASLVSIDELVIENTQGNMPERTEVETVFADLSGVSAEVGDLVFVRYNDRPERSFSVRLSDKINKPDEGIIHIRMPLGSAILGASVDDQVSVRPECF